MHNRFRYEGIGFRLGTKLDWYMGYDIYLTGTASTAVLSGWYKNSSKETTQFTQVRAGNSRPIANLNLHDNRLAYTAQFQAGFSWQKRYNSIRTELFAGYEMTTWMNLVEMRRSSIDKPTTTKEILINDSNLSLQGLTVRWNLDF